MELVKKITFYMGSAVGRFVSSLLWSLNTVLALFTLLVYYLCIELPTEHWFAGVLMISLPVAWVFTIVFLVFWLVVRPWRALLPLMTLMMGFPLWPRTFAWNTPQTPEGQPTLQVLSYNVACFQNYRYVGGGHPDDADRMIRWVMDMPADVKCFQEYINHDTSRVFRVTRRMARAGYPYYALLEQKKLRYGEGFVGVAVFSRLPIIARGQEVFDGFNGMVWADVRTGSDTVRIITVHLESMGIRVGGLLDREERNVEDLKKNTRGILKKLQSGFTNRRDQIRQVEEYVRKSPHPVIVCGDFNDTPYSVAYGRMRAVLNNAFEDAGRGFDFSYNQPPGFIRIDHQFYDARRMRAIDFQTRRDIGFSDHYPIVGTYAWGRR